MARLQIVLAVMLGHFCIKARVVGAKSINLKITRNLTSALVVSENSECCVHANVTKKTISGNMLGRIKRLITGTCLYH